MYSLSFVLKYGKMFRDSHKHAHILKILDIDLLACFFFPQYFCCGKNSKYFCLGDPQMAHQKHCSVPRIHFQDHCTVSAFLTSVQRCAPLPLRSGPGSSRHLRFYHISLCSIGWGRHLRIYYTSVFLSAKALSDAQNHCFSFQRGSFMDFIMHRCIKRKKRRN